MEEQEIKAMNIEELREALKKSESARIEAEKTSKSMETLWQMAESENKILKKKISAVKSLADIL